MVISEKKVSLERFALLSIAAAVATILIKFSAYLLTGSVGLLSDALESFVNLAAAVVAFFMLKVTAKPPDRQHLYGHGKAEYFSSIFEGILIFIAALTIIYSAVNRLISPIQIEFNAIGISVSVLASLINFAVARILFANGKKYGSITLEADAAHLMTDVYTSIGVLVAVGIVFITGILILDPLIAILVALNIMRSGSKLVYLSAMGFMDEAIPDEEKEKVNAILKSYKTSGLKYHGLLTRKAGMRKFISYHLLMPGNKTVQEGHNLADQIEKAIINAIPRSTVITHIEPVEDKKSMKDISLDRK